MKRALILLLLLCSTAQSWTVDSETFTHRIPITIPDASIPGDISHALICLKVADAMTNDPNAVIGATCTADGNDIRITTSDGSTLCNTWKENFTAASGGIIWFESPLTDGQANVFYIYYDSSTGIADGDDPAAIATSCGMVGWWPFSEGTGTTANDISGNNYDMTLQNETAWESLPLGEAVTFDGTNDYVLRNGAILTTTQVKAAGLTLVWVGVYSMSGDTGATSRGIFGMTGSQTYDGDTLGGLYTGRGEGACIVYADIYDGAYRSDYLSYTSPWAGLDEPHLFACVVDKDAATLALFVDEAFSGSPTAITIANISIGGQYVQVARRNAAYGLCDTYRCLAYNKPLPAADLTWMYGNQITATDWFGEEETPAPPAAGGKKKLPIIWIY